MNKTLILAGAAVCATLFAPLSGHALEPSPDCRLSTSDYCFFSAARLVVGTHRIPMGDFYFKGGLGFSGDRSDVVLVGDEAISTGSGSIRLYSESTGDSSRPIAVVTGVDSDQESYTVRLSPGLKFELSQPTIEAYTYCTTTGFGNFKVHATKEVRSALLSWEDGSAMIGNRQTVTLRNESRFQEIGRRPVASCD